jgi:hypothetical protein
MDPGETAPEREVDPRVAWDISTSGAELVRLQSPPAYFWFFLLFDYKYKIAEMFLRLLNCVIASNLNHHFATSGLRSRSSGIIL